MVLACEAGVMFRVVGSLEILISLIDGGDMVSAEGFDEAILMCTI